MYSFIKMSAKIIFLEKNIIDHFSCLCYSLSNAQKFSDLAKANYGKNELLVMKFYRLKERSIIEAVRTVSILKNNRINYSTCDDVIYFNVFRKQMSFHLHGKLRISSRFSSRWVGDRHPCADAAKELVSWVRMSDHFEG